MTPILQALRTLTIRILLGLALLRQMPLAIGDYFPHMRDILLVILVRIFVGILPQDLDNLATALGDPNQ